MASQASGLEGPAPSYGSPLGMGSDAEAAARRAAFARTRSLTMTRTKRRVWRSDARALKEILSNWVNLLLVTVPLGLAAGALKWSSEYVFVLVRGQTDKGGFNKQRKHETLRKGSPDMETY